jgi:hypothetical protein
MTDPKFPEMMKFHAEPKSTRQGAATTMYAALSPSAQGGKYGSFLSLSISSIFLFLILSFPRSFLLINIRNHTVALFSFLFLSSAYLSLSFLFSSPSSLLSHYELGSMWTATRPWIPPRLRTQLTPKRLKNYGFYPKKL